LIDTGADSTILAPDVAQHLSAVVQPTPTGATAIGIGGALPTHAGQRARIHGPLPIILTPGALELSVIGRDVLDQFTLIYDRPQGLIFLLTPPDTYTLRA